MAKRPQSSAVDSGVNPDEALAQYLDLREKRARLKRAFDEKDRVLKDGLEALESFFLTHMDSQGLTQMGTAGVAVVSIKTSHHATCRDWDAFWSWVEKTGNMHLLQRRLNTQNVLAEANGDPNALPPGVDIFSERRASVSVSNKRS